MTLLAFVVATACAGALYTALIVILWYLVVAPNCTLEVNGRRGVWLVPPRFHVFHRALPLRYSRSRQCEVLWVVGGYLGPKLKFVNKNTHQVQLVGFTRWEEQ